LLLVKEMGFQLEIKWQGFTPTNSMTTVATVIYYSGYHPYTLKPTKLQKSKTRKGWAASFLPLQKEK
jgi:hypothetical protein